MLMLMLMKCYRFVCACDGDRVRVSLCVDVLVDTRVGNLQHVRSLEVRKSGRCSVIYYKYKLHAVFSSTRF